MGLIKIVASLVGVLVLAVVFLGAYLWFTDYEAKAEVTDRGADYAVVTPKLLPTYHYKAVLDPNTAKVVCKGYQVAFHVQTHAMKVTDGRGVVVYERDAAGHETTDTGAALACGASNTGGSVPGIV